MLLGGDRPTSTVAPLAAGGMLPETVTQTTRSPTAPVLRGSRVPIGEIARESVAAGRTSPNNSASRSFETKMSIRCGAARSIAIGAITTAL